jgi:hypothetical protein
VPKKGYTAITVSDETYRLIKTVYEKHKYFLRVRYGVRSISGFVEWALKTWIEKNFPASFEEWIKELEKELEEKEKK